MSYEVYIHVPFCLRRCGYCDFNTYTAHDLGGGASRAGYAAAAVEEMRLLRRWQREQGIDEPAVSTVFFGGGTPTVLPVKDLVTILDAVRDLWGIEDGAEVTTEANPDTVDADAIRALAGGGFTRISFGMQSAVPHVLRTLDRTHTPANVADGVAAAHAAGLRASVDLIYGAPGESLDDWHTSVETALGLGVDHLSAYALTVEPHTKMGRLIAAGRLPRPDDDDEAAKYEIVDDMCRAAGLEWYEISNWAVPGHESRHNLGYWRNADWAGVGPGAHSHYTLPAVSGTDGARSLRAWDVLHPRAWAQRIAQGDVPWGGHEVVSAREDLEERVMLGVRLREGLDIDEIERLTARDLGAVVRELEHEGLATRVHAAGGTRLVATRRGRLLNDAVIERIFDELP
ncbi:radical SAM family heme chaperone HemW [uncultured Bifidobacterium sp.]|uniref:radical SAM family heme chaperone HemW n=1 Tax=uncultured Bifidobacterium sp. TaxID=165187 RepID=UPI002583AA3C|nr:radical SAM family heme chaperone HemW [uncultured Bifidobacterium sp.]MEE0653988.1 radical SAM family heme chaperone HemW [Bifidobacterium criceti]